MPLPAPLDTLPGPVLDAFVLTWGAVWGSFLNVVIVRWPESIVRPGSQCPACSAPVRAHDNIPIVSYLLLRGRCRACKARISPRYLVVETITALLSLSIWHQTVHLGEGPLGLRVASYFAAFAVSCALVAISFIDLDKRLIPDVISLPGTLVGLLFSLVLPEPGIVSSAIGAIGGYLIVWLLFNRAWRALRGRPGMMMGDAKLLAMIGAFFGWRGALFAVLSGSILGSVVGITAALRGRRSKTDGGVLATQVPFGPFLSVGALLYLFFGDEIIAWYLGLGAGLV